MAIPFDTVSVHHRIIEFVGKSPAFFSVVTPTRNRAQSLAACLAALAGLEYPRDAFEVLVIDDGSAEPVERTVQCWAGRLPLRLLRQDNAGPASARNHGAAQARGDWLVFLDDDCAPRPNWLCAFSHARPHPEEMLGGATVNALPRNCCAEASTVLVDYVCEYFLNISSPMRFFTSNNLAVSKKGFRDLGGFDARFPLAGGEDREFCYRWLQAGGLLRRVPNAVVEHTHPLNPSTFWRKHFHYGRGAFLYHSRALRQKATDLRPEPFAFYAGLLGSPWRSPRTGHPMALATLLAISQAATVAGFFYEGARSAANSGSRRAPAVLP
ncbi:MAG TPA: glycosyltransferase [Bryobacteraceae bacterium]|nr:glycosyltransferase [Bryobacteraceae bacterium]